MRAIYRSALLATLVLGGCTLFPRVRMSNHGLGPGDERFVVEDSAMAQVMGPSLDKMDHRALLRGQAGSVVPAGAVVRVTPDYEQQRANQAPNAPLANRNPWVLVEVISSPIEAQVGWQGWIHAETTTETSAAPGEVPALAEHRVTKASRLCPHADSNTMACSTQLREDTPVRVIACAGERAQVELWAADGMYTTGFVNTTQLDHPCEG